jgi:CelD/BcsL family acetyltransferase involved in cellulose biosynthesis
MQIELIETKEELEKIKSEWNKALGKNEINEIFLTIEWIEAWLKAFWGDKELFFITVMENGKLIGAAPLVIYDKKIPFKITRLLGLKSRLLGFAGRLSSDYNDFIITEKKKEVIEKIFDYINSKEGVYDFVDLTNIPKHSSTVELFQQYQEKKNIRSKVSFETFSPTHIISKKSEMIFKKESIIRGEKSLSKMGEIDVAHFSESSEVRKFFPDFVEQHVKRWRLKNIKSQFLQTEQRNFIENLFDALSSKQILLSILKFDGKPIAYTLSFVYNRKIILYNLSFDINFSKYSPGLILLRRLSEHAIANNLEEIDFSIGDEGYKQRFATEVRENMNIRIYTNFIWDWIYNLERVILSYPFLVNQFKKKTRRW